MVKCSFCGKNIMQSRLRICVDAAGRAFNFCSKKCRLNMMKVGRESVNVKWVKKEQK